MGVDYILFWRLNPIKLKPFLQAEKLRQEQRNRELWLQGAYVYEAVCRVSPVLNAFAKAGTEPIPYLEKPYGIGTEKTSEQIEEEQERIAENERLKAQLLMSNFIHTNRANFC